MEPNGGRDPLLLLRKIIFQMASELGAIAGHSVFLKVADDKHGHSYYGTADLVRDYLGDGIKVQEKDNSFLTKTDIERMFERLQPMTPESERPMEIARQPMRQQLSNRVIHPHRQEQTRQTLNIHEQMREEQGIVSNQDHNRRQQTDRNAISSHEERNTDLDIQPRKLHEDLVDFGDDNEMTSESPASTPPRGDSRPTQVNSDGQVVAISSIMQRKQEHRRDCDVQQHSNHTSNRTQIMTSGANRFCRTEDFSDPVHSREDMGSDSASRDEDNRSPIIPISIGVNNSSVVPMRGDNVPALPFHLQNNNPSGIPLRIENVMSLSQIVVPMMAPIQSRYTSDTHHSMSQPRLMHDETHSFQEQYHSSQDNEMLLDDAHTDEQNSEDQSSEPSSSLGLSDRIATTQFSISRNLPYRGRLSHIADRIMGNRELSKLKMCRICGKFFSSQPLLSAHMRVHRKGADKPYECDQCNVRCVSVYNLRLHKERVHSNTDKNFHCPCCGKKFRLQIDLNNHFRHYCKVKKLASQMKNE